MVLYNSYLVDWWQVSLPSKALLLFKGFQDSKNWEYHGKILGLVFLSILFQNEEGLLKNDLFALLEDSNASFKNIWRRNWHLKTTKTETYKYCFWTVRQNLETKLTFWGSSFNLLWNSVVLFKFNHHRPTTGACRLCNCPCSLKDSKNQRTSHAVVKVLVSFFLSILFENKEKPMKKGLLQFW